MKKRLFSILFCSILAVVCAIGLTACKMSNKQIYEKPEVSSYVFNKTEKIDGLDGYKLAGVEYGASSDNLYLFSKENDDLSLTLKLYNYTQNKVVEEKTVSLEALGAIYAVSYDDYDYYAVIDTVEGEGDEDSYKFTLKNASGKTLATIEQDSLYSNANIDLLFFEKEIYRFNKGGIELVKKTNELTPSVEDFDFKANDLYFVWVDSNQYRVYDKNLNFVNNIDVNPEGRTITNYGVLSNGKILVQYKETIKDTTSKNFTYFDAIGNKVKLYTYLINPVNGNKKEIKSDFELVSAPIYSKGIIGELSDRTYNFEDVIYNEKLVNVTFGREINNKRLANAYVVPFALSNNGKVTKIDAPKGLVNNYEIHSMPNGRLIGLDYSGNYVISDAKLKDFKLISEYAYGAITQNSNRKYFATEKAVYDYDLNKVFDLSDENTEIVGFLDEGFIYSVYDSKKFETKYYLFNNGTSTEIEGYDNFNVLYYSYINDEAEEKRVQLGGYTTKGSEEGKYNICTEAGVLFANVEDVDFANSKLNDDNSLLINVDGSFYRLSVEVAKK